MLNAKWLAIVAVGVAVTAGRAAEADLHMMGGADVMGGPVEELSVLDDFTADSQAAWKFTTGSNVTYKAAAGRDVPGIAASLMQIDMGRKDPGDSAGEHNWISMKRALPAGAIGKEAKGLRWLICSPTGGQWWMKATVRVGTETYGHVMEPTYPMRAMTEHVIPFAKFTAAAGKPLTREQAALAEEIGLDLFVAHPGIYLDRVTTYRQRIYTSWVSVVSSHREHNLFEPGEAVAVTCTPCGTPPAETKGFRWEVQDFFEKATAGGKVTLDGSARYVLDLTPKTPGYYELRAWWVDAAGKDLGGGSRISAQGSMPMGIATFAVMPHTVAQNIERFKTLGSDAFFGLHGDFLGMADRMGLTWRFEYSQWQWLEPEKPDRSHGPAPWAAKLLAEPPKPDYRRHILPSCSNLAPPAWAKNPEKTAPPFANWDDYLAMLRDSVAVEKHLYPHQKPRIYGAAWEINLNMPPHNFAPPYTPQDIVELHRRVRQTVKAADADSIVIGPCPSTLSPQWMEQVFKAGLLEHVDAIETHAYAEGAFTPEENDYPGKLAAIRELMRRYNHGKVLPIYVTEAAFRGILGSKIIYRTQAQVMTRLAIILKGEGVKVFLPFYGIDYDRDGWWGFCFNLEVNAKNPWGTKHISPKPTVNAYAACADVLEGAAPVRRVAGLGDDVWAYLFDRQGTAILAIWTPAAARQVSLPAGGATQVELVDIMGHRSQLPAREDRFPLSIDGSPQYLIGVVPAAMPAAPAKDRPARPSETQPN